MLNGRDKAIARKGISHAIKLVDLGVQVAAPGAVSAPTSYVLERMREYVDGRCVDRYEQFHRELLNRSEDARVLSAAVIDAADYHALLNACLSDIEDEKTGAFAILTRSIALGDVPANFRRHFILSLRDISFEQLDFICRLYVITKNRIQPAKGAGQMTVKAELEHMKIGSLIYLNYEAFNSRGYLEPEKLTELGIKFVEACTNPELLEPGAYDYRNWSGYRCMLISGLIHSPRELPLLSSVESTLRRHLFETGGTLLRGGIDQRLIRNPLSANCCVLITDLEEELPEEQENTLRQLAEKIPVVHVFLGTGLITNPIGQPLALLGEKPTTAELENLIREIRLAVSNFAQKGF